MIRGAIDYVSDNAVGGWLYSEAVALSNVVVLAFQSGACVGASRVGLLREDLRNAGLGDGRCGFLIEISPVGPIGKNPVSVRIDGGDLCLMPNGIALKEQGLQSFVDCLPSSKTAEWMRRRGWLSNEDANFITMFGRMGVVDVSLVPPRTQAGQEQALLEPMSVVENLYRIVARSDVVVRRHEVALGELYTFLETIPASDRVAAIVAVRVARSGFVAVVEGSHKDAARSPDMVGAISYAVGHDRILVFDPRLSFKIPYDLADEPAEVFLGSLEAVD